MAHLADSGRPVKPHFSEVVLAYKAGESTVFLARKYLVTKKTICNWLEAAGVSRRDSPFTRKHSCDEEFFKNIDSEQKAYWLGFLTGDGGIQGRCLQLVLCAKDRGHVEKFKSTICATHPVRDRRKSSNRLNGLSGIAIHSRTMTDALRRHGVLIGFNRTRSEYVPADLWRHYLRGLVDADGSVCSASRKGRKKSKEWIVMLCGNRPIVEAFARFAGSVCVARMIVQPAVNIFRCDVQGNQKAMQIAETLYGDATVYLDRKYAAFLRMRSEYKPATNKPNLITYDGETRSVKGWAEHFGFHWGTLNSRLHMGWAFETAISKPPRPYKSSG